MMNTELRIFKLTDMKKSMFSRLFAMFLGAFVFAPALWGQKPVLEPVANLKSVVVYTDRAMINKETSVSLKRGENLIRLPGLSVYLIDASVQAGIVGRSDVVITEVKVDDTYLNKSEPAEVKKLRDRLEVLNGQINNDLNEIEVIKSSSEFLKKVVPFAQSQKVSVLEMESHARFLEESLTKNFKRIAALEVDLSKLKNEGQSVSDELNSLAKLKGKNKTILISVLSNADVPEATLSVSYVTTQVGWTPQYDARADFNNAKIDLTYFASMWQSTGEDWMAVDVTISTSQPYVYGNVPELPAWYVDVYTPRPPVESRAKSAYDQLESVSMSSRSMEVPSPFDEFFRGASVSEETTSFSFTLPRKVDLPSDGEPHRVPLASAATPANFTYLSVPKKEQNAFLKTTLANPFVFPLLPGSMNVFSGQKLVGTVPLDATIVSGAGMEIPFGVDEAIKIERKLKNKKTEYAGLLSRETSIQYEYSIELTNSKSKEIILSVQDQFPVSRNEKIKVVAEAPKGSEAKVDEEGKITWEVTLAPGANKTLTVKYTISYPKDLIVTGLE